jgi:hypothetical protein
MKMTIIFSHSKYYNPIFFWFRSIFLGHTSTHVAFGIEKDNQPYIFHMSGKGAVRTSREKFIEKNVIVKEYKVIPDLSDDLSAHLKYLGTGYHHVSALIHLLALLIRPLKQFLIFYKIRNMFYCANFARQIDRDDRIRSWRRIDRYWASVDELQTACRDGAEFIDIT